MDPSTELESLLDRWRREVYGNSSANPVPILTSIAELIERETEAYLKLPIDPFDVRHPSRTYPECSLGFLLKILFKNDNFMNQLTTDYITARANFDLHVISSRLLLDILPGLDSKVVFYEEQQGAVLVKQLLDWAEKADFPLHSYATGLLGAAMEVEEISSNLRDQNNQLVPLMLNRLHQLTHLSSNDSADQSSDNIDPKDLVDDSETKPSTINSEPLNKFDLQSNPNITVNTSSSSLNQRISIDGTTKNASGGVKRPHTELEEDDETLGNMPAKMERKISQTDLTKSPLHNECSSSSWAEAYMSGSYQMHPLNVVMQQRFILQYLSALGEYQELLVHMFELKALSYILHFIDSRKNPDIRLAFDALKFLAAFLSHKKFALEFLDHGGLPQLLKVNRHGMASSGVSICLYCLALSEDVMERICWMKRDTVEKMVAYGLWLLECSPDTSRCHAATFFSLCFQFPLLLRLFDRDNGLRKLLNVLSMRGLFSDDPMLQELSDDELYARRQTTKQVCVALKKYTRAHFIAETRKYTRTNLQTSDQECKPSSISDENVMDAVELHRQQSMQRFSWRAIDKIVQEEGVNYLLKIIAHICNEGIFFAGKSDTVRSALETLVVCSLSPRVQQLLLREVVETNIPYPIDHPALAVIVMCADPRIFDADCQKSALNILINFVCTNQQARVPPPMLNTSVDTTQEMSRATPGSGRKKGQARGSIDLSLALRKAIWSNNGTLILPKLLTVNSPLTEADTIRSLSCRVLCGLAKEESIRQIMSKLPLFTDGQLQSLMKEPILPEKRIEHASFCKYCKELIELVTGTPVTSASGIEPSLPEIRRRLVVAQTKIDYDRSEAYLLIHNYLNSEGFPEVAAAFYKAANLAAKAAKGPSALPLPRNQPRSPPLSISNQSFNEPSTPQTPANKNQPINPSSPGPVHFKTMKNNINGLSNPKSLLMQKSILQPSQLYKKLNEPNSSATVTLDSILTEYLRHQHSLCKNPVSTCPPFKLLAPHRCPEPTNKLSAPLNIASRIIRRRVYSPKGGVYGAKYDRHYVYSKFRPVRLVRDSVDMRTSSTCCAFSTDGLFLFVGTDGGRLKAFNIGSGLVEASYECHINDIGYIEASCDDNLILTTSPDSPSPQCILWTFTDVFERKHRFDNDLHAEFGKASSDRIITTQELFARLWDTQTGTLIQKYEGYHRYSCNRATLNYSDTLVLNDGVLWDVRNSTSVHKFGKFNERINGLFHPNGNEIICNSQVWDIRNFRLLRTVPAFDMCQLKFNSTGDVIFSTILDDQSEVSSKIKNQFKTSFRTFDSHDYSTIATIDLKRTISDLAVSSGDEHIALVESSGNSRCFHEEYITDSNVCRLYEIGRPRYDADIDLGDEDDEDADDEENEDDDDDDDDDDDEVGEFDEFEEEDFDDVYDSDDAGDEDGDDEDEDASNSQLSSSVGSNSAVSHDEIVPFYFHRSSDIEDEEDAREGYGMSDEEEDPPYSL